MDFKTWLAAENKFHETEDHPFEKWSADYESARDHEIAMRRKANPYGYSALGISPPRKSDEMLKTAPQISCVHVAELEGYTAGLHARNLDDEVPAEDPYTQAEWVFSVKEEQDRLLLGLRAFYTNESGGSFHERWCRHNFYVIVPEQLLNDPRYDDLPTWTYHGPKMSLTFFKYEGLQKLVGMMKSQQPEIPNRIKQGETSDEYWSRLMRDVDGGAPPPDQTGYNPRDDYYKRQT